LLTDKKFFDGDINYLLAIKKSVSLPILRKDFIIEPYQIYESRAYGADAILLIVGALSDKELETLVDMTHQLGMECVIEIHNEGELCRVLKISDKVRIIGVNNRDLNTMKTDFSVIENLINKIPRDKIVISESGIKSRNDVQKVRRLGVNGILVGTFLMKAENKTRAIKELLF
jgi:indole-3-glycerol phosphate synthase